MLSQTMNSITTVLEFEKEVGVSSSKMLAFSPTGLAGIGAQWLMGNCVYFGFCIYALPPPRAISITCPVFLSTSIDLPQRGPTVSPSLPSAEILEFQPLIPMIKIKIREGEAWEDWLIGLF